MNTLSMLLYLAEISGNIAGIAITFFVISTIGYALIYISLIVNDFGDINVEAVHSAKRTLATISIISLFGFLFPSQNTVYLIIASETAESVATSESGSALIKDIQTIVSQKLKGIIDETN